MKNFLKGLSVALLLIGAVAVAQTFPKWGGSLEGIADYTGAQFSTLNPFPVSIVGGASNTPAGTSGSQANAVQGVTGGVPVATSSGGYAAQVYVVPTLATTSHAAGTSLGGLLTFASAARTGILSGLVQQGSFRSLQGDLISADLMLFSASPTSSTVTDGSAVAIASADLAKLVGVIHITDCTALGAPTLCEARQAAESFLSGSTSLYAVLVTRTAVTPATTTDLTVGINVIQN